MGRLTTAQKAAILAGNRMANRMTLTVPLNAAHSSTDSSYFHNDLPGQDLRRVTKVGRRSFRVWNVHPSEDDAPEVPVWQFTAANPDSFWLPGEGNAFRPTGSSYQALPTECDVLHEVLVHEGGGTWTALDFLSFPGRIIRLKRRDRARSNGDIVPDLVDVWVRQLGAWATLGRVWTADDARRSQVTNGTYGDLDF